MEHILYLGGFGRETPFTSTTEVEEFAEQFAGASGAVWITEAPRATAQGARHWSKRQLLENLKGFGKGRAKWKDRFEVAQARRYVQQWAEHLLEWSSVDVSQLDAAIAATFDRRGRRRGR